MTTMLRRKMVRTELDRPTGMLKTSFRSQFPDPSVGDLVYFDQSRPHDVQIRPMLDGERPEGSGGPFPPGATWVVYQSPSGSQLRALVTMPAPYRRNVRSNVVRAIRKVAQVSPAHAQMFELALSGKDPFDQSGSA